MLLSPASRGRMPKPPVLRGRPGCVVAGVPSGPKTSESIDALRLQKQQLLLRST